MELFVIVFEFFYYSRKCISVQRKKYAFEATALQCCTNVLLLLLVLLLFFSIIIIIFFQMVKVPGG